MVMVVKVKQAVAPCKILETGFNVDGKRMAENADE